MRELPQYQSRFYSLLTLDSLGLQAEETISNRSEIEDYKNRYLSTRNLANSLWMFFDIFLTSATGVPSTNKLCVVLESRRICFASMCITLTGYIWALEGRRRRARDHLYEFNTLTFLFACTPRLKSIQVLKNKSVAIVWIAWSIRLFWWSKSGRDGCKKRWDGILKK